MKEDVLARKGLLSEEELDRARLEMGQRGGHLLDHVLALVLATDDRSREFLRENFGLRW